MAQATRRATGNSIPYTPVSAVTAGDVVVIGTMVLFAEVDIAASTLGALACEGVFDVVKTSSTFSAGDAVYWDVDGDPVGGTAGSGGASSTASTGNLIGWATADAATGAAVVRVKSTSAKRTATIAGSVTADDITGSDSSLGINGLTATAGGAIVITGGTSSGANAGGAVSTVGGTGGASQTGGAVSVTGGVAASGNAAGGTGTFSGGVGTGTGAGGAVTTKGGASGTGATGNGGAWSGGGGAALSTNGTGGAASLTGGVATGTGTGGAVTITSGASAGASGTAGAVTIDAGAAAGGTGAPVAIGPTNATGVYIGAGGAERALIKGIWVSGTIAVAVPTIADAETDEVAVDLSGMTVAPAVGDAVIAIPLEALPTSAILNGAYVSATDTVKVSFGTLEGGSGVTGANKNFKFLIVDLT